MALCGVRHLHTGEASALNDLTPRSAMVHVTDLANAFPQVGMGGVYTE